MKFYNQLKLRSKLILFFILACIMIGLAGLYMYTNLQLLTNDATDLIESNLVLTDVYRGIDRLQNSLEVYLSTNNSDDLIVFYDKINQLNEYSEVLIGQAPNAKSPETLINTANMIINYVNETEQTIIQKRRQDIDRFSVSYNWTKIHHQTVKTYIESIMSESLIESTDRYQILNDRMKTSALINIALLVIVVTLLIFMIIGFSKDVTQPITTLTDFSSRMASGDYNLKLSENPSKDEIGMLYQNFQYMADSITNYIESLKDKAKLEQDLADEKLQLLEVASALKEAELSALQAQVNPHFIFNTINIGAKIAQLQEDNITSEYLENTASLFRYNLRGLDHPATLKEEFDHSNAYLSLLKTRFGDLIEFDVSMSDAPEVIDYLLPRMTIQPLVENAYIHGLSDIEEGGYIKLYIQEYLDSYGVVIENSGNPFDTKLVDAINTGKSEQITRGRSKRHGHTTGIGLNNLIQRLQQFLDSDKVIVVKSVDGVTKIELLLPKLKDKTYV